MNRSAPVWYRQDCIPVEELPILICSLSQANPHWLVLIIYQKLRHASDLCVHIHTYTENAQNIECQPHIAAALFDVEKLIRRIPFPFQCDRAEQQQLSTVDRAG
jgi:hypothetical protein